MFAKSLERVLRRLLTGADLTGVDAEDLAVRFDALRGSAFLPRGRERRDSRLTSLQIANAVLGLTAQRPRWAAQACAVLARLQPIGGANAPALREASLRELIARLLDDETARDALLHLRLSVSESGQNAHGSATAMFQTPDGPRASSYVSGFATSALAGAQEAFDSERRFARASRDLVLNRRFFVELARAIAWSANTPEPEGDGSEYDADDVHRARMGRLRIGANAFVLNMAVDTHAAWPREETLITFEGIRLILMPPTRETVTSIHVDLHGNKVSSEAAQTVIRRFLSVLAWEDDQYAVLGDGWAGNSAPVAVSRPQQAFATAEPWLPPLRGPRDDRANRALAHYRAGCNAEHAGLVTYAVLSFYKVLEVRFRRKEQIPKWIVRNLDAVRTEYGREDTWARFDAARGEQSAEDYIRIAYRHAAAHASMGTPSDEDETQELVRLNTGADVLRALARKLLVDELGIEALLADLPPPPASAAMD